MRNEILGLIEHEDNYPVSPTEAMWKKGQEAQPSNTHLTPGYVRQNSHYILITIE